MRHESRIGQNSVWMTICVGIFLLTLLAGPVPTKAQDEARPAETPPPDSNVKVETTAPPATLDSLDAHYEELMAQVKTLDEYAPDNFEDFKDLEKANQLMELLDFNKRKSNLLIDMFNVLEEQMFPLAEKAVKENPSQEQELINRLVVYTDYERKYKDYDEDSKSIYKLQADLNSVFLKIERLEKSLERLHLTERQKEKEEKQKEKEKQIKASPSLATQIFYLHDDIDNARVELAEERDRLTELEEKEKKMSAKVDELRQRMDTYKEEARNAPNRVNRLIKRVFEKVTEIRLNGLEIPRLNTVKTFIYWSKTSIDDLEKIIKDNNSEILGLEKQRTKQLIEKAKRGGIVIVIALIAVFLIIRISRRVSKKVVDSIEGTDAIDAHKKQRYQTLSAVILSVIRIATWTMAVLWILGELEIDIAPFLVAAGGISLAIGFGAQSLVKDMVSGFFMLMEEQFALGDGVTIGGVSGAVEKISLRTVRVRGLDGTLHTIPNGSIGTVSNKTYQWSRAVVEVGVSYDADPQKVLEVLNEVAKGMYEDEEWKESFLEEPSAQGILSFGESAINFRVLAKTTPGGQWALSREMMIRIKNAFDKEDIEIPYNYVNVNLVDHTKVES